MELNLTMVQDHESMLRMMLSHVELMQFALQGACHQLSTEISAASATNARQRGMWKYVAPPEE